MTTDNPHTGKTKPHHLIRRITRMEIRRYLVTPGFWLLGALLQAGLAWQFFIHLDRFIDLQPRLADKPDAPGVTDLVVMPTLLDAAALLLLIAPLLSMRSLSEERKTGSLLLLQAAPVSDLQLLLGKLFGLVAVLLVPITMAVAMTTSLAAGTAIDLIRIATGSLGLALTVLVTAAGGLWVSGTTRHPSIAAALLYALFLFLWMAQLADSPTSLEVNLVQWVALPTHFEPLLEGRLRTGDIVYFLVLTIGFSVLGWLNLARLRGAPDVIRSAIHHLTALALIATALWLSSRLPGELDLSAQARHSLSPTTVQVLKRAEGPIHLTAYVPDKPEIRRRIRDLIAPYAHLHPDLALQFIDPKEAADAVRDLGIPASGAVIVSYEGATELLRRLDETTLTSALQRLLVRGDRWIVGIKGHGERRLDGAANHDLRDFATTLEREGYHLHTVDLPTAGAIPDNTALLVVADPRTAFLLHEQAAVADYIARGGNLLWLAEPEATGIARWLEDQLPVNRLPGSIVDAAGARLGLDDPRLVAVGTYATHPVTAQLDGLTLFPDAAGLVVRASGDEWTSQALMSSSAASWNETGSVKGEVSREADLGETPGPLAIGLALERADQRILVFGDSDFLSNAYLGNGANLDLGLNAVRWLSGDDKLLDIPAPSAPDARLDLSPRDVAVLAGIFLILLPLGMLAAGLIIHFRRSRR